MGRNEMQILVRLHRNVNALDKKMLQIDVEHNLSFRQFMVLEMLYSNGDMSIREVRDKMFCSVGAIYLIADNLVKMRYVEKRAHKKDRRVCILHLTKAGQDTIDKIIAKNEALLMEVLEPKEKEELAYLLKKIGGSLNDKKSRKESERL